MLGGAVVQRRLATARKAHFRHAAATIKGQGNPFADARTLVRPKKHAETHAYSLGEVEDIISALVERVDAQLVVALAFFLGLRPGEIAGLQWGDVDSEHVHIRRVVVRGDVGNLKTDESVASLPLLEPVRTLLFLWNQKSGSPSEGWIFQNRMGKPTDLRELARRVIIPALAAKGIAWHGLYAGRRGAGTILTELTGDALAAQVILRHKNLSTTTGFYVKQVPTAGANGLRLLEERAKRILKAVPATDVSAEDISIDRIPASQKE
jgi:integrase